PASVASWANAVPAASSVMATVARKRRMRPDHVTNRRGARRFRLPVRDSHQLDPFLRPARGGLLHVTDAPNGPFAIPDAGLERRLLLREQCAGEAPVRQRDPATVAEDPGRVQRVSRPVELPVVVALRGMRLHHEARLRATLP